MSDRNRNRNLAPPGKRPEEIAGLVDEAPLPAPPSADAAQGGTAPVGAVPTVAPRPLDPNDPLLNEPLGALVPNDPVSEIVPEAARTESPHDPAAAGPRGDEPNAAQDAPEVPGDPEWEPRVTQ